MIKRFEIYVNEKIEDFLEIKTRTISIVEFLLSLNVSFTTMIFCICNSAISHTFIYRIS